MDRALFHERDSVLPFERCFFFPRLTGSFRSFVKNSLCRHLTLAQFVVLSVPIRHFLN